MPQTSYGIAQPEDLPRLREIFLRCFGAAAAKEADYIFSQKEQIDFWAAKVQNRPAAMLAAIPVTVVCGREEYPARYLYGVSTDPVFWGRGLCSGLLEETCRHMARQGEAFALLYPSSEQNRRFYADRGFADCSAVGRGEYAAQGGAALPCTAADAARYDVLRRKFAPEGLQWGSAGLSLQKGWLRLYGGDLWLLGPPDHPAGCAAVSREGEIPHLRELLTAPEDTRPALEGLCRAFGADRLTLALPQSAARRLALPEEPFMMLRRTGDTVWPGPIYTSLAMD